MTDNTTLYTLAQVAENNGKNGKPVWLIIKDCVYDVTGYLDEVWFYTFLSEIFVYVLFSCVFKWRNLNIKYVYKLLGNFKCNNIKETKYWDILNIWTNIYIYYTASPDLGCLNFFLDFGFQEIGYKS